MSFNAPLMGTFGWLTFTPSPSILITDYCERAEDRLIEQFKNKPNIFDYLCVLITELQDLEFVFGDLLIQRQLNFAVFAQLDGLGDIVGIDRQGLLDTAYRTAIRFQIGINFSNGEPETLIDLTKFITQGDDVHLTELYPARVVITTNGTTINSNIVKILEESAPAGVKIELMATYGAIPFAVEPDPGDVDPNAQGFSEPNYAPDIGKGGHLVEKFI